MMATKGVGVIRKFVHDLPDLAGSLCYAALGLVAGGIYFVKYDKDTYHQHKFEYTVIRAEEADSAGVEKGVYN